MGTDVYFLWCYSRWRARCEISSITCETVSLSEARPRPPRSKLQSLDVSETLKMQDSKTQDRELTDRLETFLKTFGVSKLIVVQVAFARRPCKAWSKDDSLGLRMRCGVFLMRRPNTRLMSVIFWSCISADQMYLHVQSTNLHGYTVIRRRLNCNAAMRHYAGFKCPWLLQGLASSLGLPSILSFDRLSTCGRRVRVFFLLPLQVECNAPRRLCGPFRSVGATGLLLTVLRLRVLTLLEVKRHICP